MYQPRAFSRPSLLDRTGQNLLGGIRDVLGLEYCGIDFGLASDGSVLLFEANATMVIIPPGQDAIWSYRRLAIEAALDAARTMIARRVTDRG